MTTRIIKSVLALCALTVASLALASGASAATSTIMYGPLNLPAGTGTPHTEDHTTGALETTIGAQKPCTNCTITAIKPDLVYSNGSNANWDTGATLHHFVVLQSGAERDLMCPSTFGDYNRLFASGNERTPIDFGNSGYGLKLGTAEQWAMNIHAHNYFTSPQTVYIKIEYTYTTSTTTKPVRTMWLDADGCSTDSEFPVGFGETTTSYNWSSPIAGQIIGAAGHLHDHSVDLNVTNTTKGSNVCTSTPTFGGAAEWYDTQSRAHISGMSSCYGNPVATIAKGENLRVAAKYNVPSTHHAVTDAMGIMMAFVVPSTTTSPCKPRPNRPCP